MVLIAHEKIDHNNPFHLITPRENKAIQEPSFDQTYIHGSFDLTCIESRMKPQV